MYETIEKMIKDRNAALKAGNIAKAEGIKNDLLRFNVTITDTVHGTEWRIG